jgi:hypothetical protein
MPQAPTKVLFPSCGQPDDLDRGNKGRGRRRASNICCIRRLLTHPFIRPYNSSHHADADADAAASAATDDLPCPGLSGKNKAENRVHLKELLATAEADGAEARKPAQGKLTQDGDTSRCIECGKTGRRDRLVAHVVYKHLDQKTWVCPLWCVCFRCLVGVGLAYLRLWQSEGLYNPRRVITAPESDEDVLPVVSMFLRGGNDAPNFLTDVRSRCLQWKANYQEQLV